MLLFVPLAIASATIFTLYFTGVVEDFGYLVVGGIFAVIALIALFWHLDQIAKEKRIEKLSSWAKKNDRSLYNQFIIARKEEQSMDMKKVSEDTAAWSDWDRAREAQREVLEEIEEKMELELEKSS